MGVNKFAEPKNVREGAFFIDSMSRERVADIAQLDGIESVVTLADMHVALQESPVSLVTASSTHIYPQLSSNVMNCGMSVMSTSLTEEDLTEDKLMQLNKALQPQPRSSFSFTNSEILELFERGAEFVVEKFNLDPAVLNSIENEGNMFKAFQRTYQAKDLIPRWLVTREKRNLHLPLPPLSSNHFLEIQKVKAITGDDRFGIVDGSYVLYLHGDYSITSLINWHYAARIKMRNNAGIKSRLRFWLLRNYFQLRQLGVVGLYKNWHFINGKEMFRGIPYRSEMGGRTLQATYMGMNYAYGLRLLSSVFLEQLFSEVYGTSKKVKLVWDVSHDSLQLEKVDGQEQLVSRKGAGKMVVEKPVLIAGANNMDSFLGVSMANDPNRLNSYDHGCSHVMKNMTQDETKSVTMRFSTKTGERLADKQHIESCSIQRVVSGLSDQNVVEPLAWLEPTVNFKYR